MKLKGKIAVVTGAGRGIGLACARRFAEEGADVAIADIDEGTGRRAEEALLGLGRNALFIRADVSQAKDVAHLFAETLRRFGRVDVLLNNAGIMLPGEFLDLTERDFDRVLSVNLKSAFLCGQAAARQMVAQGNGGAIV